jgi:hypothetical protein
MAVMTKKLTTISVSKKNHGILANMGKKGEPFDEILTKLIEKAGGKNPLQTDAGVGGSRLPAEASSSQTIRDERPNGY